MGRCGRGRRGLCKRRRHTGITGSRRGRRRNRLPVGADQGRRWHGLGVGAGIGGFEVDDVAQEDLAVVELIAPDDDGLEGERALAQAGDHRFAAGFDALGDGHFALARKQLDRPHCAQIHAHGIIGAHGRLFGLGFGRDRAPDLDQFGAFGFCLFFRLFALFLLVARILGLDDIDAHLAESRENVLDLLGIDFLRGQHRVHLVMRDAAALLGAADELLDGRI